MASFRTFDHLLCAVRWYFRYSLSYRDVTELLAERGLDVAHTTVWRWILLYGPELNRRLRSHLKPTNRSWRVDETYICVKGKWAYLYRAIDSQGATIDFVLAIERTADAAKRLFSRALAQPNHPQPRVINTDKYVGYPAAISESKDEDILRQRCKHRPIRYLNNILEQDHRAIKRRVNAKQHFRRFSSARKTIDGYEAMHMIRKGQARWVKRGDIRAQLRLLNTLFGLVG